MNFKIDGMKLMIRYLLYCYPTISYSIYSWKNKGAFFIFILNKGVVYCVYMAKNAHLCSLNLREY
jgi:hypothetical protein